MPWSTPNSATAPQVAIDLGRALGRQVAADVLNGARRCQYYRVRRFGEDSIGKHLQLVDHPKSLEPAGVDITTPNAAEVAQN